jgi:hypothetical protein
MTDQPIEAFGDLLRDKIAELDAAEAPPTFVADDPVDRLGLDARRCLQLVTPTPRPPRAGHGYPDALAPIPSALKSRHMNIVR